MIASLLASVLLAAPAGADWMWITSPRTEIHAAAKTSSKVVGTAAQGTRVRIRERSGEGASMWLHVVHGITVEGWIPAWDAAEARPLPPPPITPPAHSAAGAKIETTRTHALIDHRALDNETTVAGADARKPEDDLVDLQLIVDGLYLDPVSYQPSQERRDHDAKNFEKGLQ